MLAVEKRTEGDLPVQISKIYDSLQRVEQITKEIDQKVNKFNGIYKNASNILSMLEQFGVDTRSKLGEVDSFEVSPWLLFLYFSFHSKKKRKTPYSCWKN